jgi:hypothetical protein
MKAQIVLACAVLMFSATATCLAQDDSGPSDAPVAAQDDSGSYSASVAAQDDVSPSDGQIAEDEVLGTVAGSKLLGNIPTDATSLALGWAEAAGVAEAITSAAGGFISGSMPSYTAPPAVDDAPPAQSMNVGPNWYEQQREVEQEQATHAFDGYPYPQVIVPAGPSISACYSCW